MITIIFPLVTMAVGFLLGVIVTDSIGENKKITELERTIDNLKLADAFKAGNADNTEARKKIDRLIKEIDKCITLMEG